jgi:hypothetical protein
VVNRLVGRKSCGHDPAVVHISSIISTSIRDAPCSCLTITRPRFQPTACTTSLGVSKLPSSDLLFSDPHALSRRWPGPVVIGASWAPVKEGRVPKTTKHQQVRPRRGASHRFIDRAPPPLPRGLALVALETRYHSRVPETASPPPWGSGGLFVTGLPPYERSYGGSRVPSRRVAPRHFHLFSGSEQSRVYYALSSRPIYFYGIQTVAD